MGVMFFFFLFFFAFMRMLMLMYGYFVWAKFDFFFSCFFLLSVTAQLFSWFLFGHGIFFRIVGRLRNRLANATQGKKEIRWKYIWLDEDGIRCGDWL
ncbi:hypothetical protein BZA77DRAFT_54252 [Pyronema omphalodes]|nr:hypothetical protein BZA77DRAFT_54252 [Pyronema omphalodes]